MVDYENLQTFEILMLLEFERIILKNNLPLSGTYDSERLYQVAKEKYTEETKSNIECLDETSKVLLYNWLKETYRYRVLNELIKRAIYLLLTGEDVDVTNVNYDNFSLKNMNVLIDIMLKQVNESAKDICNKNVSLTPLNRKQIEEYVKQILKEVDPTLEWLKIYEDVKASRRIIYLNELTDEEKKQLLITLGLESFEGLEDFCIDTANGLYIILTSTYTTLDVRNTIHEFIHYIVALKNGDFRISNTLAEFPSILYELYAISFLERQGFSKDEIVVLKTIRLKNSLELAISNANIFGHIRTFIDSLEITEEQDISAKEVGIKALRECLSESQIETITTYTPEFWDARKMAHMDCDLCIERLLLAPYELYKTYPYVIGNYLATHGMKLINDDRRVLIDLKQAIENLFFIDPFYIFQMMGLETDELGLVPGDSSQNPKRS